jgi:predicted SAM-dependent methyltransferase
VRALGRLARTIFPSYVWSSIRQEWPLTLLRWSYVVVPHRRKYLKRLRDLRDRVHLGCGARARAGWFNIDCASFPGVNLLWDIRHRLPLADGIADCVYSEHVLEHFEYEDAIRLLREVHRILRIGGVFRIGVPNAAIYLRAYVSGDEAFFTYTRHLGGAIRPLRLPIDVVNQMFRMGGHHRFAWDERSLELALKECDFASIRNFPAGQGSFTELVLDDPDHAFETVYFEAVKG